MDAFSRVWGAGLSFTMSAFTSSIFKEMIVWTWYKYKYTCIVVPLKPISPKRYRSVTPVSYDLLSKLLVSPLIALIVVPYIIPYISPL